MSMSVILVLSACLVGLVVAQGSFNFKPQQTRPLVSDPYINMLAEIVPNCPLEVHPDTDTMFIMRGPLGNPEPRNCPPKTIFMRSICSCITVPLDKCNLRPSGRGAGWYEENVFGMWLTRPCGPGSAYNPSTCDCSLNL